MIGTDLYFEGFVPNDVREAREVESDLEIDFDNLDVSPVQCVSVSVCVCMMKAVYHLFLLIV